MLSSSPDESQAVFTLVVCRVDAVDVLRHVRVPVEDERRSVRVGTHILKEKPVIDFGARHLSSLLVADLVEAVTGRTKNSRRNHFIAVQIFFTLQGCLELDWPRVEMVIDHIIKRAIHSVVDVQGLVFASAALSPINL